MIISYKPQSKTPLEIIQKLRIENPELKDKKMAYAGRLDPMAEGLLIVLVGDECKDRDKYQTMDKVYEFDVLAGFSTDTYDVMGLIKKTNFEFPHGLTKDIIAKAENLQGNRMQEYPPFSSKPVKGKPLFWWAKNDKLDEIKLPKKLITIQTIEYVDEASISSSDLLRNIKNRVENVNGDFRQERIIEKWEKEMPENMGFKILKFEARVTTGTYIRSIVNEISKDVNFPLVTFNIKRTRIKDWDVKDI